MLRKVRGESPVSPAIETPDSKQRTITTGLLSSEQIQAELLAIGCAQEVARNSYKLTIPAEALAPWTAQDQDAYVREFSEDVVGLRIRCRRLKWRVLSVVYAGQYSGSSGEDTGREEKQNTQVSSFEMFTRLLATCHVPITEEDRLLIIQEVRRFFPQSLIADDVGQWAIEDLQLLGELVYCLRASWTPNPHRRHLAIRLTEEIENIEHRLWRMNKQSELFATHNGAAVHEQTLEQCWHSYRQLIKETATCLELENWVSPSYRSSGSGEAGPEQDPTPYRTDYQRWSSRAVSALDLEFHLALFPKCNPRETHSVLFQSGMGAMNAILTMLNVPRSEKRDGEQKPVFFRVGTVYAEVSDLLKEYCEKEGTALRELTPSNTEQIIASIKKEMPVATFLAPVANSAKMEMVEVTKILEGLVDSVWADECKQEECPPITLVIDNTVLGILAKWKQFDFSRLPPCIRLISYESLIKYGQDGQDIVQAGLVTGFDETTVNDLIHIRQLRGMIPTENTAHKLRAAVPLDMLSIKMRRHSRNAELFAQRLDESIKRREHGLLEAVVHAHGAEQAVAEQESEGVGGLFVLTVSSTWFRMVWEKVKDDAEVVETQGALADQVTELYMLLVILLAQARGLSLNAGTSFGFRTTRLSVHRSTSSHPLPYIRVAPGTENKKDARLLAEVFVQANRYFEEVLKPEHETVLRSLCRVENVPAGNTQDDEVHGAPSTTATTPNASR